MPGQCLGHMEAVTTCVHRSSNRGPRGDLQGHLAVELGLCRGAWLSQGFREPGHRAVAERGARVLGSSYGLVAASSLRLPEIQPPGSVCYAGCHWGSEEAPAWQATWQVTHRPCPLSLASHLKEVWLAVAENVPFARLMLHGLMGRLQSRFAPRATATSKADVWRLAAVDPLMVSGGAGAGPGAPRGFRVGTQCPLALSLQILCTMQLLIEKVGKDDPLRDLFPDLVYTLLMHLGGSQGPEAVSPILKTWRLIRAGTLPEDISLQRCSRGPGQDVASGSLPQEALVCLPLLVGRSLWRPPLPPTLPPRGPAQGRSP